MRLAEPRSTQVREESAESAAMPIAVVVLAMLMLSCGVPHPNPQQPAPSVDTAHEGAGAQQVQPAPTASVEVPIDESKCPMDYLLALNADIDRHKQSMQTCYIESMVDRRQTFGGSVDLKIEVSVDGAVVSVTVVENTISDPPLLDCVLETIRGLRFPAPPCGRIVLMKKLTFKAKTPGPAK